MTTEEEMKSDAYSDESHEYDASDWQTDYDGSKSMSSDGVKLVSAYHFVWSILLLLLMCAATVLTVITGIVGVAEDPEVFIATAILGFVVFVLLLLSVIYGVVGYGLWTQRQWARTAAIALAILSLPAVPIGTLGGAVTIWYLLKDNVAQQFR